MVWHGLLVQPALSQRREPRANGKFVTQMFTRYCSETAPVASYMIL
jgi:hypothetical protein